MPNFAFNARYALLTYPQCGDLDPFHIVNHISSLKGECIIGRERHADGGTHLHAFCDFGRKLQSRRSDLFDVDNRHPNISPSKGTPEKGWDYACKDGDIVAGGLERPSPNGHRSHADRWAEIINASCEREFWDLVRELDPKALCTQFPSLRKYVEWIYAPKHEAYKSPSGIEFGGGAFPQLVAWKERSLTNGGKLLIMEWRSPP